MMTQAQRRLFLIRQLLKEMPQYHSGEIPADTQEQKRLLRSLFNVRMPAPASREFLSVQDCYLQEENTRRGIVELSDLTPIRDGLYLWQGDITALRCDGIVNAANSALLGCFQPCHACINLTEAFCPTQIAEQSICIDGDISTVLSDLISTKNERL